MWMRPEARAAPARPRRSPAPRPEADPVDPEAGRRSTSSARPCWPPPRPSSSASSRSRWSSSPNTPAPRSSASADRQLRQIGVLLTAARDRRSPTARRRLGRAPLAAGGGRARPAARCVLLLYVLLPPVIFFNLAAADIDLDHGVGLGLGAGRRARSPRCSPGGSRAGCCSSPAPPGRRGALRRAQRQHRLPRLPADRGAARPRRALRPRSSTTSSSPAPRCCSAPSRSAPPSATKAGETPRERVRAFFTRNPPLYAAIARPAGARGAGARGPRRRLPGPRRRDPADRLLRRRRDPRRGRRARRAAAAAAADPAGRCSPSSIRLALVPALLMLLAAPLIDLPAAYRLMAAMP